MEQSKLMYEIARNPLQMTLLLDDNGCNIKAEGIFRRLEVASLIICECVFNSPSVTLIYLSHIFRQYKFLSLRSV